jgi:hypothetical protein|tara:strand:+ start:2863 stop:3288 length:426 start_codon:yes stop_codon:yes gene_type:complete
MIFKKEGYVRKDSYDLLWDKCERLEEELKNKPKALTNQIFKLEREVSRLRSIIMRLYDEQNTIGDRYVFSNIPNDHYGKWFVQMMQIYLNNKSYTMKARGQYLDKDKLSKGESWRNYTYGQPLHKSKCIRLYIDKKKKEKA